MIVVADTSVLLNLAYLGGDDILASLFGEVLIPEAVNHEFARMSASSGRFGGLRLPPCCRVKPVSSQPSLLTLDVRLDIGAAEALVLAQEERASAVLLDEINGREAARRLGFTVLGTLGILIAAKQRGLMPEIASSLRRLIVEASFRVSAELLREALKKAGELP